MGLAALVLVGSTFDVPVDPGQFRVVAGRYTDRAYAYSLAVHSAGGGAAAPTAGRRTQEVSLQVGAMAVNASAATNAWAKKGRETEVALATRFTEARPSAAWRQRTSRRELQTAVATGVLVIYYTASGRRRQDDVLGWAGGFGEHVVSRVRAIEERLWRVDGFESALSHADSVVDCFMGVSSGATSTAAAYGGAESDIEGCARRAMEGGEACERAVSNSAASRCGGWQASGWLSGALRSGWLSRVFSNPRAGLVVAGPVVVLRPVHARVRS